MRILRIHIRIPNTDKYNADPDPVFRLNVDPDPGGGPDRRPATCPLVKMHKSRGYGSASL